MAFVGEQPEANAIEIDFDKEVIHPSYLFDLFVVVVQLTHHQYNQASVLSIIHHLTPCRQRAHVHNRLRWRSHSAASNKIFSRIERALLTYINFVDCTP